MPHTDPFTTIPDGPGVSLDLFHNRPAGLVLLHKTGEFNGVSVRTRAAAQQLAAALLACAPQLPTEIAAVQPGRYAASCPTCRATWQIDRATVVPHTLCCPKCGAVSQILLRPIGAKP